MVAFATMPRRASQRTANRALRIAESLPVGHAVRRRILASMTVTANWVDQAVSELAAEEGLDADDFKVSRGHAPNSVRVEGRGRGDSGESEWVVFKSERDAEHYAVDYVEEMIDDDPSMFTQSWIQNFIKVSPTDIRMIAGEDGDNYAEDIRDDDDGERVIQEAGLERAWEELQEAEWDLDDEDDDYDRQLAQIEKKKEALIDDAVERVAEKVSENTAYELENNLMEWLKDLGYDMGKLPGFVSIDSAAAAQDAVDTDGVAHFLDSYDGYETELRGGAVAYGTN
jgi:hypothetical protein